MLNPLKSYKNRNDIFTDLDLSENEMQAVYDIFEQYGPFDYDHITRHCFLAKPILLDSEADKGYRIHTKRLEETYRGIDFVVWVSEKRKTY